MMSKAKPKNPEAFMLMSERISEAADVLKAMASDTRLKILCALSESEMPVNRLAELTNQSSSAVSQHLSKLRAAGLVESRRDAGDCSAAFVERAGDIGAVVGSVGRLSDLIVLASSQSRWEQPFRPILEAALRQTGRPILVTPTDVPEKTAGHIVVAWNDTTEAARALSGAMPLLKKAASVTVLSCHEGGGPTEKADPAQVVDYLALHGVAASPKVIKAKPRNSARNIIDASLELGADLVVLGSVIHSRTHSLVFGSLTEEVLKAPKLSALLVP